jgi:phytanoyl-CoA hydroxylase
MTDSQKEFYDKNGYLVSPGMISKERIDQMNRIIDGLNLKPSETVFDESGTGKIKQIQYLDRYDPIFAELIEEMRPYVEKLIGESDLKVVNMQLFEKHPDISKPTRAHQDNAYTKINPATSLTVWIALDDIDEENGCLYYAPGSHVLPTRRHQRYHPHTTFRFRSGVPGLSLCLHEHPSELDIPIIVKAGDVNVHNCNLIHRAGANLSKDKRRRAIGIIFMPNSCRPDPRLIGYHKEQLKEDIELQKYKDPLLYEKLLKIYNDL